MLRYKTRFWTALSALALCAAFGPAAQAQRHSSFGFSGFGHGLFGHGLFGSRPHGGVSFFIASRPSRFGGGRSGFSLALDLRYGSYYNSYCRPSYYGGYAYQPSYYPTYAYPVYTQPTVVYNVVRDDYRPFDSDLSIDRGITREVAPPRRAEDAARDDANDYYLYRRPRSTVRDPALRGAIDDIEAAFRSQDVSRLEKHVDSAGKVILVSDGTTRRELGASDYLEMTRDALKDLKTKTFTLDRVVPASNGSWLVWGKHVLGEDGNEKSYAVSFVLKKSGESWQIAEVGADPQPRTPGK